METSPIPITSITLVFKIGICGFNEIKVICRLHGIRVICRLYEIRVIHRFHVVRVVSSLHAIRIICSLHEIRVVCWLRSAVSPFGHLDTSLFCYSVGCYPYHTIMPAS